MALADIRNIQLSEPIGVYALGFFDSAHAIFERAEQGRGYVDYCVYPGCYCIRHGLELFTKQMTIYIAYVRQDAGLLYAKTHPLADSWTGVKGYLEALLVTGDLDQRGYDLGELQHQIDVIDDTLKEFHEMDSGGTLFRYPEDIEVPKPKSGAPPAPRTRRDAPPPFEAVVNLADWAAKAKANLDAVQLLIHLAHHGAEDQRTARNHPSEAFHDLVLKHYQLK
jgi:hypothetical protein